MSSGPDPRVPLVAIPEGSASPAGWVEVAAPASPHFAVGCACCAPRGPLARALASLWLAATRDGRTLAGVAVRGAAPGALPALLAADALCAARYRVLSTD